MYSGEGVQNIPVQSKKIGISAPSNAVIDLGGNAMFLAISAMSDIRLENLTIQNGYRVYPGGGGLSFLIPKS